MDISLVSLSLSWRKFHQYPVDLDVLSFMLTIAPTHTNPACSSISLTHSHSLSLSAFPMGVRYMNSEFLYLIYLRHQLVVYTVSVKIHFLFVRLTEEEQYFGWLIWMYIFIMYAVDFRALPMLLVWFFGKNILFVVYRWLVVWKLHPTQKWRQLTSRASIWHEAINYDLTDTWSNIHPNKRRNGATCFVHRVPSFLLLFVRVRVFDLIGKSEREREGERVCLPGFVDVWFLWMGGRAHTGTWASLKKSALVCNETTLKLTYSHPLCRIWTSLHISIFHRDFGLFSAAFSSPRGIEKPML